jgi:dephospho-CoA kinase
MIRLGLTGSIGMGKSTTAEMFRSRNVHVHDSDAVVHALYLPGGAAVAPLVAAFGPQVVSPEGGIDRHALSAVVLGRPEAMDQLNTIVHPLVAQARLVFDTEAKRAGASLVIYDVPLLFETGGDRFVDAVVVVSAPEAVQRVRVLARPGMSEAKLDAILTRQVPDAEKRARAHFVIETGFGLAYAAAQVDALLAALDVIPAERSLP